MLRMMTAGLVAALGLLPPAHEAPQGNMALTVRAVRFYRADLKQTRVKGLVQIPLAVFAPQEGDPPKSYTVSVRVSDSTGLTLFNQSWVNRISQSQISPEAYTVEIIDFAVAPGHYRLMVSVGDSASGRKLESAVSVEALSDTSAASDLLIAPAMRTVADSDGGPRPGEFRTGDNLVTAAAETRLTPLRSRVYYLLEAYASKEQQGTLDVAISDSSGHGVIQTKPLPITVSAGGSVLKGQLDLAGLPAGRFRMTAELKLPDRVVRRSGEFVMAPLGEALTRDTARRAAERITDEGYFGEMTSVQLDDAEAPLLYIAEPSELTPYNNKLSLAAKRRFMTEFWTRRDPTPGTPRNERRERFYSAVDYANRTFREGGRNTVPGWRSDRGRIYARNGAPDETLRRIQQGRAPPYEVWRYASGKGPFYIFADRSGFGAFSLMYSNDLKETGLPGWGEVLGAPAVQDIGQWLGVDLLTAARRF